MSRYHKGKTNLDFTEARDSEWQWHQLGCMQVCISFQADNHASTPPLSFLQAGCPSCRPTNSVKALKAVTEKRDKIETHNAYETTAFYCNRDILPQTTHLNIFTGLHYSAAFIFLCKHLAHYYYFQLNFPSPAHVRHKIANHFHLAVCFTHIWQLSQCFITHQINSCFVQTI